MNHFLLPYRAGNEQASNRFGNVATARLLEDLALLGCESEDLRAKVFGGACVLDAFRNREHHLGQQNVEVARRLLREARIPVIAEDVGGRRGRRLIFNIELIGELHGSALRTFRGNELLFNVGSRVTLTKKSVLLISAGRSIHSVAGEGPQHIAALGIQFNF